MSNNSNPQRQQTGGSRPPKKMGRPPLYSGKRTQRTLNLGDDLWDAIGAVAGEGKRNAYIEQRLRELPEIQAFLAAAGKTGW